MLRRTWHRCVAAIYAGLTGLKPSNYTIGKVDFSPRRVRAMIGDRTFDCALFEYWHSWPASESLRKRGTPTILDTHNVLWKSREQQLQRHSWSPRTLRRWSLDRYRRAEEQAWTAYDAVIAINRQEHRSIKDRVPEAITVLYAPMGIDLGCWPYLWSLPATVRLAYYGGLGSPHNQMAARTCVERIMPFVWRDYPNAQIHLMGSNPPPSIVALQSDPRVVVTGFVKDVPRALAHMSLVLCPWQGTYGFRSRIVEIAAVGAPVVASYDAVNGMDFESGRDILLGSGEQELASHALRLLRCPGEAAAQSRAARQTVEQHYSVQSTYDQLVDDIAAWIQSRRPHGP